VIFNVIIFLLGSCLNTNKSNSKETTKIFALGYYLEKTDSIIHSKVLQSILDALIE
jgi:hypothetical protein